MLTDTTRLDLVSHEPSTNTLRLIIVIEDGEWLLPNAASLLHEKVNSYAMYALQGQLQRDYPEHHGATVVVVISAPSVPPASTQELIKKMRGALEKHGLALAFEIREAA